MLRPRWLHALRQRTLAAALLSLLTGVGAARAQIRWTIDTKSSLAWWQVSPNLNHLWATTCPEEPSWRPGEGRSPGWHIDPKLKPPRLGYANVEDTIHVPLYPRPLAQPICTEAVKGEILAPDTVRWRGVRGEVTVRGATLITGEDRRDLFTRQAILQTTRFPEIRFTIDSVVDVTRHVDTLRGTAVGVFTLHGVAKPMTAAVRAWPEAGGLRVLAKFRMHAQQLIREYGLSKFALGLGVVTNIWKDLFMGVDLLLHSEEPPRNQN